MDVQGVVVRVVGSDAVVEVTEQPGGCGRCDEPGGCRSGILARPFSGSCREYRLSNPLGLVTGERVVVRVGEGTTARTALLAYGLPAIGAIFGASAGVSLWPAGNPDFAAVVGAVLGFGMALVGLRWRKRLPFIGELSAPILLRRDSDDRI